MPLSVPPLAERAQPGLSETLTGPAHPHRCRSCGAELSEGDEGVAWSRWRECDEWDQLTNVVITLCRACERRLIDRHPRLYHRLSVHEPWPGTLELCALCLHRDGSRCQLAKINGGPGVVLRGPKPTVMFLDGTRGGRRAGWVEKIYDSEPRACDRRQLDFEAPL